MSTYSASKAVALAQSAEEGAAIAAQPLSLRGFLSVGRHRRVRKPGWVGFGVSCLWWPDIGDWSRTHQLAAAAFVIVGRNFSGDSGRQPARAV